MDIFKCGICFERYDEDEKRVPRTLTECGHTICESCALKLLKYEKVACPFDRIESRVNDGNIKSLKKNFAVLEAIQAQFSMLYNTDIAKENRYENEQTIGIPCDENASHIAVLYCTKCEVNYCEKCWKTSHVSRTLASHKILKVSEKREPVLKCPLHPYNVAELFCVEKDCLINYKVMCANCHLYTAHKNHAYKKINEVFGVKMKEISELLKETDVNIEIVRSCINDIGELPGNINEDQEYIDARNKIDDSYKKRLEELNSWKQSNMEILEKETKQKIETNKKEKGFFIKKLEELETLKLECLNAKQLKKTEYFEKLEEIEIIIEKLKCFDIKEMEKISMKAVVEYPNVITFAKHTSKGKIVFYYGDGPFTENVYERIKQLGGINHGPWKFQLKGRQIEFHSYHSLKDCENIEIKALVIISLPFVYTFREILGENTKKLKTDGIVIIGHAKKAMKNYSTGYWNYNIPDIAKHVQVPILFANQDDSEFVENIVKGNQLGNPYFQKYP